MLQVALHALSAQTLAHARLQVSLVCAIHVQKCAGARQCAAMLPEPNIRVALPSSPAVQDGNFYMKSDKQLIATIHGMYSLTHEAKLMFLNP